MAGLFSRALLAMLTMETPQLRWRLILPLYKFFMVQIQATTRAMIVMYCQLQILLARVGLVFGMQGELIP